MVIDKRRSDFAKCLESRSVKKLDNYIKKNKDTLNKTMVEAWEKANKEDREAILNKLISTNELVSNKLKCEANRWLKQHGFVHEIGRCRQ